SSSTNPATPQAVMSHRYTYGDTPLAPFTPTMAPQIHPTPAQAVEWPSPRQAARIAREQEHIGGYGGLGEDVDDELAFVLQLSLAEEESRRAAMGEVGGEERVGDVKGKRRA